MLPVEITSVDTLFGHLVKNKANVNVLIMVKSTNKTPLFSKASKSRAEGGSVTERVEKKREWKSKCEKESFHTEIQPEFVNLRDGEIQKHTNAGLGGWWPSGNAQEGVPHIHKHLFPVLRQTDHLGQLSACVFV